MGVLRMDKSFHIVLGMTIAYAASFLGMFVAWFAYRRKMKERERESQSY